MADQIDNFRLKIRNTQKLKRQSLSFSVAEAQALEQQITELEKRIEKLENELLQNKTMTVDIIGQDF
jgi:flagellar biosynthesis chaperone FliJ